MFVNQRDRQPKVKLIDFGSAFSISDVEPGESSQTLPYSVSDYSEHSSSINLSGDTSLGSLTAGLSSSHHHDWHSHHQEEEQRVEEGVENLGEMNATDSRVEEQEGILNPSQGSLPARPALPPPRVWTRLGGAVGWRRRRRERKEHVEKHDMEHDKKRGEIEKGRGQGGEERRRRRRGGGGGKQSHHEL
ncbi:hypothetical protein N1851_016829 [Merluccius polli]|uniref:Uncharacterized protein n=1 Tax=Merluccius polli TaxID=89951 RepID=A0AA47MQH5_MERPO|nr:hypothetical protein N1851_016829 [Merluccius polli]